MVRYIPHVTVTNTVCHVEISNMPCNNALSIQSEMCACTINFMVREHASQTLWCTHKRMRHKRYTNIHAHNVIIIDRDYS